MKRILLAYDGGAPAQRALEQTIELAQQFGAQVGVISVVPVGARRDPRPRDGRRRPLMPASRPAPGRVFPTDRQRGGSPVRHRRHVP